MRDVLEGVPNLHRLRGKRILVTGGSGLIGAAIVDLLCVLNADCGWDMKLILAGRSAERLKDRFSWLGGISYVFRKFDLMTDALTDDTDYIMHCAGICSPKLYAQKPVDTMLSIIQGTKTVLDAARERGVGRTLILSSSEIYGVSPSNESFKEGDYAYVDLLKSRACYASGKRAAETLCAAYASQYSLDVVILRPGHIYGPPILDSDDRVPAQFSRCVMAGRDIVLKSSGESLRSYCYSLDCAGAALTVLVNGVAGEAYNVSNAASVVTIQDFAECVARASGVKVVFADPSDAERKGFNPMNNSSLDASKLEKLGWTGRFSLPEGVERMLRYADWPD